MSGEPDEQRQSSVAERAIWEELHKINLQLAQYSREREEYRPKIDQVLEIMTVAKGISNITRGLVFIAAPVAAVIYWIKDHLK
jgi:hypothetical protein